MGGLSIIINCLMCYDVSRLCVNVYDYVSTCVHMCLHVPACVYMCPYISLVSAFIPFVSYTCVFVGVLYMYRYRIVGTQYGFSPLCVVNLFVLGLLLILLFDLMLIL